MIHIHCRHCQDAGQFDHDGLTWPCEMCRLPRSRRHWLAIVEFAGLGAFAAALLWCFG